MYYALKNKIKKVLQFVAFCRIRRKVSFSSKGSPCFHRNTKVTLVAGAKKEQVCVGEGGAILCYIKVAKDGRLTIGDYTHIGPGTRIECAEKISIGKEVIISRNVVICDNNNHPLNPIDRQVMAHLPLGHELKEICFSIMKPIIIEDNVWIGENSRICKGVTIGQGAIVAANAVVTKDVPKYCIAAGNPARIVKSDIEKEPRIYC